MNLVDLFPELTATEMELLVMCWNKRRATSKDSYPDITIATLPFVDIDKMISALKKRNTASLGLHSNTDIGKLVTKLNRYKDDIVLESLGLKVVWKDP